MSGRVSRSVWDRFWSKVDQSGGPDACWPWLAGTSKKRNGARRPTFRAGVGQKAPVLGAHVVALALSTDGKVPPNSDCAHSCDNPMCCNPAHLSWLTHAANMADYQRKYGALNRGKVPRQPGWVIVACEEAERSECA